MTPTSNCLITDFTVHSSQRHLKISTSSKETCTLLFIPRISPTDPLFVMAVTIWPFTHLLSSKILRSHFWSSFFPHSPAWKEIWMYYLWKNLLVVYYIHSLFLLKIGPKFSSLVWNRKHPPAVLLFVPCEQILAYMMQAKTVHNFRKVSQVSECQ